MNQLFQFLLRYRSLFLFLTLEAIAFVFIYRTSNYHGTRFFNSSNSISASILEVSDNVTDYISLKDVNNTLVEENAALHQKLRERELLIYMQSSSKKENWGPRVHYKFMEAAVVNNDIYNANNFITLDKGREDGIKEGSGVISSNGVAGIIRNVGSDYSVAYSMLHSNMLVSCRLKTTGDIASVAWDGRDYRFGELRFLPRHIEIQKGDTLVTSGYNSVFPGDILIGIIEEFEAPEESTFYDARIRFSTDFSQLSKVYVIENIQRQELDSVQNELSTDE